MSKLWNSEGGEGAFVEAIRSFVPADHWAVSLGIGDDAAVLYPQPHPWVVTCDSLVEGVHYRSEWSDAVSIGHKLVHVNMSDLAAMGAWPAAAFVAVVAQVHGSVNHLLDVHRALQSELSAYGATLAGGNFSASPTGTSFSLTLLGLSAGPPWTRAGARVGDRLYVTGHIGDSGAGLRLLMAGHGHDGLATNMCVRRHLRPQSRLATSRYLTQGICPTAVIDVSDGLARDAGHVADASGVSLRIFLENVPLSCAFWEAMATLGMDPDRAIEQSVGFGEDYELLFTVAPQTHVPEVIEGVTVTQIGEVVPRQEQAVVWVHNGRTRSIAPCGWDHFNLIPQRSSSGD